MLGMNDMPPGLVALLAIIGEWSTTLRIALLLLLAAAIVAVVGLTADNGAMLGLVLLAIMASRRRR